jgi:hypothetical protein
MVERSRWWRRGRVESGHGTPAVEVAGELQSVVAKEMKHVKPTAGCHVPAMWVWICVDH